MIEPIQLIGALEARGVERWFGVPDSVLRGLGDALLRERPARTTIAANEGAAIGLAAGHALATGAPAAVWMQNAGLGNAVNPLLSLMHEEVYDLPLWLIIGWRGAPGERDEPQHRPQGRVQQRLLALLDLPEAELPPDAADLAPTLAALEARGPRRALVVRPGRLSAPAEAPPPRFERAEAIAAVLAALRPDDAVVVSTGMAGRELWELQAPESRDRSLLVVGSMGHASAIALGLALAQPRRVVLLDGDGALLMHAGTLATIGRARPANLLHIVLNNGVHDSVGAIPSGAADLDLCGLARACGYAGAGRVEGPAGLSLDPPQLPHLIDLRIAPGHKKTLPRPEEPLRALGRAFSARLKA